MMTAKQDTGDAKVHEFTQEVQSPSKPYLCNLFARECFPSLDLCNLVNLQ